MVRYLLTVSVLCAATSVRPAQAWPGVDWEQWRTVTTWTQPTIDNPQVGQKELVPLLADPDNPNETIDEIRAWEQQRATMAGTIERILGQPSESNATRPATSPGEPPEVEILGGERFEDHLRRHIRIRSATGDWIPAYLLIPDPAPEIAVPAILCLHQTVAQGKAEPIGIQGDPEMAFARELVRRGFVCIAPDMIGFGERIRPGGLPYDESIVFYREHPAWSFMGKMIADVRTVIDYLETLPCVDPLQIGSVGHSHGAYSSLFAAAFEPRIALVVASCGFTTFRADPTPERWSHMTSLIPQLGVYLPHAEQIPFDWHHILALIAPRPVRIVYSLDDAIFPNTDNLDALLTDVRSVYGLYGAAGELAWNAFEGGHAFPEPLRNEAWSWLEERLFPVGDLKGTPASVAEWEQRRPLIQRVITRAIGTMATQPPAPEIVTLESVSTPHYRRDLIEYTVAPNERIRAYLCIPHEADSPRPAVLALHGTRPAGKGESVGIGETPLAFADELARRGYVTLAPDSISAGERIDRFGPFDTRGHYLAHPDVSAMTRMLYDAERALDLLEGMENVDLTRLGVIGHSLGAEVGLMLAAFDPRVRATVASCGYSTFEAEHDRLRWSRDRWFSYMPRLRVIFQQGRLPHWDWDDVLRLVAPRGLYQYTAEDDGIFPEAVSAYEAGEQARAIWQLYGKQDRLVNVLTRGGHTVSHEGREAMYEWLDSQLGRQPWRKRVAQASRPSM
jgi:dienelactone hydrolase